MEQTTTAESDTNVMEYSNHVAYAYIDGQLFMDETYTEEVYEMNEWI